MKNHQNQEFQFYQGVVIYPLIFVMLMWIVFWLEIRFNLNFTPSGIYPRRFSGLQGVLFSPFIHGSLKHLFNNSIPILALTAALFYFYRKVAWRVLFFIAIGGGLLTWIVARPSYHIGASGVVYGLASFLFFKGIWSKHYRLTALSLIVVFIYGSLVWGTMPLDPSMSWEGHLSGFIVGLILAFAVRQKIAAPKKYEWEKEDFDEENDPFLKQFDADGNFIDLPEDDEIEEEKLD